MAAMIADQSQRDRALDVSASFIVQAPAGSGKTSLLVARYLALLKIVRQPEEIVAITFTRKAAAEMRARVLSQVPAELAPRLKIQTIDALCASLTAQMPVLSRFGAQPGVAEDAGELYAEAAVRTLRGLAPPVARLLAHLDNDMGQAARLLAGMLMRRDQWLGKAGRARTRAELEATLQAEHERLLALARAQLPDASPELAAELLTEKNTWRKRNERAQSLEGNEAARLALAALKLAPPRAYSSVQWEALDAILALLEPAVEELRRVFAERGEVDFTEIAHGALTALGTDDAPTDLLLALDVKVQHLLVDEFQDTSNSQWRLLELLTAGWQPDDGRTVFVVGDPMQSIYRFRDAQVGLFLRARREGLPNVALEPLRLATNFRSQGAIVSWVNAVFPVVLPAAEDESSGAVPYSASTPFEAADADGAPSLELFSDREAEAKRVAQIVASASGKTAILVRNRSHLDALVPELKRTGIRFRAVEIEQLGEKQVVQDLYALTRALTHLADRVAWLAVLRAPWCALTLAELSSFFEGRAETVWELMQGKPRLSRMVEVLAPALADRLRGTLRDCVEGVWLALGGPACLSDPTELADAEIFFDELERLEEAGELSDFSLLADALGKLYAEPDVEAGPEAVEIMTIHKAKGLEFDTVIVPGLDRAPRTSSKPLFAMRPLPGDRLLLAPIDETGGEEEVLYSYVRSLDREAEDIEAGRLFYVACTRAESRLYLLGCVKVDEDGVVKMPSKRSLLGLAWPAVEGEVRLPGVSELDVGELVVGAELRRLVSGFEMPEIPKAVEWKAGEEGREEEAVEFSWAGETARHVGTVVHRWLQRIAEDELRGWDRERIEKLVPRIRQDLRLKGVQESEAEVAALLVSRALSNATMDERGRWLLGPHSISISEFKIRDRARSYRIDRYVEDPDGKKYVVDYKISEHEGAGVNAFLDREQKRYAPQLDAYARIVGGAERALFFPLQNGWRTWE